MADRYTTAMLPLIFVLFTVGLLLNLLVLLTTGFNRKMWRPQHLLVANMSAGDMLFLMVIFPFVFVTEASGRWPTSTVGCNVIGFIACVLVNASISNIAIISVNRYACVLHPSRYNILFTRRRTLQLIFATWVYSLVLALPTQLGWGDIIIQPKLDLCMYDWGVDPSFTISLLTVGFLMPIVLIIFCYTRIFFEMRRIIRKVTASRLGQVRTPEREIIPINYYRVVRPENARLAAQLLVILVCYLVCWLPYLLTVMLADPTHDLPKWFYNIVSNLIVLNFLLNPAIFFYYNRILRKQLLTLVHSMRRKHRVEHVVTIT